MTHSLEKDLQLDNNILARKKLNKILNSIISGDKPDGNVLIYNHPPEILVDCGVKDYPILMSPNEIMKAILSKNEAESLGYNVVKAKNFHKIGLSGFNKAINSLSNPNMIIWNNQKIIVFSGLFDYKQLPIIIPMEINTQSMYMDNWGSYNVIMSIHGRTSVENFISKQLEDGGKIIYKKYRI